MKVLHIVTAYDRHADDGITPWLVETIRRLRETGVDVEVLAPSFRGLPSGRVHDVMVHRFRYAPAGIENLTHDQTVPDRVRERPAYLGLVPGYLAAGSRAATRVVRAGGHQVMHVHWPLPQAMLGWAARRATGARLVCSYYGVEFSLARSFPIPGLTAFVRRSIRTADAVTAISSYTAALVRGVYDRPVERIPYGPSFEIPAGIPARTESARFRLLFAGRLVERKGVKYLLDAVAAVRSVAEVELDVVGEGPERAALERHAHALGIEDIVRFRGFVSVESLARHYVECDAFVLPAVTDAKGDIEGLGVVLIEALANGRPVIASDAGGITDIVLHDRTGLLVPQADTDALAAAILRLMRDPALCERLAVTGHRHVRENFSWSAVIGSLTTIYERLAASPVTGTK